MFKNYRKRLQLAGSTFAFSEPDYRALSPKYSEIPNSRPVFFPFLNLRRKKKRIYWTTESMSQRRKRKIHF